MCVCARARVCVRACVRSCMRVCVCVRARVCVCVRASVCARPYVIRMCVRVHINITPSSGVPTLFFIHAYIAATERKKHRRLCRRKSHKSLCRRELQEPKSNKNLISSSSVGQSLGGKLFAKSRLQLNPTLGIRQNTKGKKTFRPAKEQTSHWVEFAFGFFSFSFCSDGTNKEKYDRED